MTPTSGDAGWGPCPGLRAGAPAEDNGRDGLSERRRARKVRDGIHLQSGPAGWIRMSRNPVSTQHAVSYSDELIGRRFLAKS